MSGRVTTTWSDLDWALFLLDGACQSIVDEFHGEADPRSLGLLAKHRDRIDRLRRAAAQAERLGEAEKPPCTAFCWIGQPITSCDMCGKPAWDHDYDQRLAKGGPFAVDTPWENVPWGADLINKWRRSGHITPERAMHLLSLDAGRVSPE